MKIHLIPSHDLEYELYARVLSLLQAVPGINTFHSSGSGRISIPDDMIWEDEVTDREAFEKSDLFFQRHDLTGEQEGQMRNREIRFPHIRGRVSWDELFRQVRECREHYRIPAGEFAILLTPTANEKNWFAMLDEEQPYNGFIHTDEWEHYVSCDPAIPVAFEVIALAFRKHVFSSYSDFRQNAHERPVGCLNDLCMNKNDIILKMRTADVCLECMQKVRGRLSEPEIHHAIFILESLRIRMLYAQNFRQKSPPSRLSIRTNGRIYLTDYANAEIRMPSMEKAIYLLFLNYPKGIYLGRLDRHAEELRQLYRRFSTRGEAEDMDRRIDDLLSLPSDQLSVKVSRIKRAFTDTIGASLADHYIIQGENSGRKRIKLDRRLVDHE